MIPDAPDLISTFLNAEQDASCKRNAFMMLLHVDQTRALDYLSDVIDQVTSFGDILQLIIVELIYKVRVMIVAISSVILLSAIYFSIFLPFFD